MIPSAPGLPTPHLSNWNRPYYIYTWFPQLPGKPGIQQNVSQLGKDLEFGEEKKTRQKTGKNVLGGGGGGQ